MSVAEALLRLFLFQCLLLLRCVKLKRCSNSADSVLDQFPLGTHLLFWGTSVLVLPLTELVMNYMLVSIVLVPGTPSLAQSYQGPR